MHPTKATGDSSDRLRQLPSIHELLSTDALSEAELRIGRSLTREAARMCLERWRIRLRSCLEVEAAPTLQSLASEVLCLLDERKQTTIRSVINATGILLHTGLGRAALAQEAMDAICRAAGYCNLEIDLVSGERTRREKCVENDLCDLTSAEAALVVNNNAGATGLALAALAKGREVIVSHGELIEIGGGFRLPEVFQAYGARLRAVGTTNRTRLADYASAVNSETGALMLIHTSNYRVVGFTERPDLKQLVELGKSRNIPVLHDIGSGALLDMATHSPESEPIARDSIEKGADLVLFSGDKLLGGPQCGILVGKRHFVEQLAQHPMSRAMRIDKLTLAALQATLAIYRRGESDPTAYDAIPILRMLRTPIKQIEARARTLAKRLSNEVENWKVEPVPSEAYAGGGSLPGNKLESWAIAIQAVSSGSAIGMLAQRLRTTHPAVLGRLHRDVLYLDLRGVQPSYDECLFVALAECIATPDPDRATGDPTALG